MFYTHLPLIFHYLKFVIQHYITLLGEALLSFPKLCPVPPRKPSLCNVSKGPRSSISQRLIKGARGRVGRKEFTDRKFLLYKLPFCNSWKMNCSPTPSHKPRIIPVSILNICIGSVFINPLSRGLKTILETRIESQDSTDPRSQCLHHTACNIRLSALQSCLTTLILPYFHPRTRRLASFTKEYINLNHQEKTPIGQNM